MDGFTNEQIQHLAQYILDEYGPDLTGHRLTDAILLVLEDIAGFEMADVEAMKPIPMVIEHLAPAFYSAIALGGKRGRGSENKTPIVAAVSCNEVGHPLRMNMNVVDGFKSKEIARWAKRHVAPGSVVVSDGLACFSAVTASGCTHHSIVTGGGPESVTKEEFTWVNTMIGNVKNALTGTYHSVGSKHKHLPRYLAEFCYRFNRRINLQDMSPRLVSVALRTPPMPYRLLKLAEAHG